VSSVRLVVLGAVAAAVAALALSFDGRGAVGPAGLESAPIPAAGAADELSSTWFCAAGGAGVDPPAGHQLFLMDPSGGTASATLTAFDAEGAVGDESVEVAAPGPTRVDLDELFGAPGLSVVVESSAGELVVEHRLVAEGRADQVPCATSSSDRWYFPSQSTVRGAGAQLHLFNPFPEDASVDVTASVQDGVREPPEWQGLIVPAGTSRVVDLGVAIQRRDQFSVSVESRNGQVVAETSQTLATPAEGDRPATRGLRLQLGVPRAAARWSFAQGFAGPGVSERLVVHNPGDDPAEVVVQVTPYGGAELPPEPFELEVPARRYAVLDLSAETRIPAEGLHAVLVETSEDTPVVVGRVIDITGGREDPSETEVTARPPMNRGSAIGTGTPVAATLWAATGLVVGEGQESVVAVHNPSSSIVVVTATVIGGAGDGTVLADEVEVAPGDSLAVATAGAELGRSEVTVLVEANAPVVVERTVTFGRQNDLSVGMAVPLPLEPGGLRPLGR
jgi:hypothetical protein